VGARGSAESVNFALMKLIRRPWVWLARVRHRRGYGVHSPAAFAFITGVIYERTPFYAFDELLALHPWWERWLYRFPVTCRRMLFRVANHEHPSSIAILGQRPLERAYLSAAVPSAKWVDSGNVNANGNDEQAAFVFVAVERLGEVSSLLPTLPQGATLVCEGIYENTSARTAWKAIKAHARTTLTYDLYTYGIALFDRSLTPAHYIVDF